MLTRSRIRRLFARPILEILEDRLAPATFTLTTLADGDAEGTLRHAIIQSNATPEADTIIIPAILARPEALPLGFSGDLTLNGDQLPAITGTLTIGSSRPTVSGPFTILALPFALNGNQSSRVLEVGETGNLTLDYLFVRGGATTGDGGGILTRGALTLTDVTVSGNRAQNGGGIANTGTLTVINSTISNNEASAAGGGVFTSAGNVELRRVTVSNNTVQAPSAQQASGGGLAIRGGSALVTESTISGNLAQGGGGVDGLSGANGRPYLEPPITLDPNGLTGTTGGNGDPGGTGGIARGGGIALEGGSLVITGSTLTANTARGGAGGNGGNGGKGGTGQEGRTGPATDVGTPWILTGIPGGDGGDGGTGGAGGAGGPGGSGLGGGLHVSLVATGVTVINCTVANNKAQGGQGGNGGNGGQGGVGGDAGIGTTGFDGHTASSGVGGDGGDGGPGGSTGTSGVANGGGVHFDPSSASRSVISSTIAFNQAVAGAAGTAGAGGLQGIMGASGPDRSTIGIIGSKGAPGVVAPSLPAQGAGIGYTNIGATDLFRLTLANSIVAANTTGTGAASDLTETLSNIASSRNNLIGAGGSGGLVNGEAGNKVGVTAPGLASSLGSNGGPTQTIALLAGSPALNAGNQSLIPTGVATDQRGTGFSRTSGEGVDIGAFEMQAPSLTSHFASVDGPEGSPATNSGTFDDPDGRGTVTLTASLGTVTKNDPNGTWTWTYTAPDNTLGSVVVTITASDTGGLVSTTTFFFEAHNVAPTIEPFALPETASEGTFLFLNPTVWDPAGELDPLVITWQITFPDGSFTRIRNPWVGFTVADDGDCGVDLTVDDGEGGVTTWRRTVTGINVAPTIAVTGDASVDEGATYTLTLGSITDPGDDTVTEYVVHWGDGTSTSYPTGGDKTHVYADGPATWNIAVDLTDEDGTHPDRANALSVTVHNVAPTITTLTIPVSGVEGSEINLSAAASDPAGDADPLTFTWTVTRPDGRTFTLSGVSTSFHVADSGTYGVSLTVSDGDGGIATRSGSIAIADVAPTINIRGAGNINEGAVYTLLLGDVTDPGSDLVTGYIVNWGDGTSDRYATGGPRTHVYAAGGVTRSITVDLADEDGTHTDCANALSVKVNAPPTVMVPSRQIGFEGVSMAIPGIAVRDIDSGNLTVTLTVNHGTLTVVVAPAVSLAGNGSTVVTLSGGAGDLNTALATLVYRPGRASSGTHMLRATISDGALVTSAEGMILVTSTEKQAASLLRRLGSLRAGGGLGPGVAGLLRATLGLAANADPVRVRAFLRMVSRLRGAGILNSSQAAKLLRPGKSLLRSLPRGRA